MNFHLQQSSVNSLESGVRLVKTQEFFEFVEFIGFVEMARLLRPDKSGLAMTKGGHNCVGKDVRPRTESLQVPGSSTWRGIALREVNLPS